MRQDIQALIMLAKEIYDKDGTKEMWEWISELPKDKYLGIMEMIPYMSAFEYKLFTTYKEGKYQYTTRWEGHRILEGVTYTWKNEKPTDNKYGSYIKLSIYGK